MRAVCPWALSRASTGAPCDSSACTASGLPVRAAVISGVSPAGPAAFGSAPAFTSVSIKAALPLSAAIERGVIP